MNYYSFHIGDYLTQTAHLSLLEHGAYRRLLDVYYSTEQPLPVDSRAVHRLVMARTKEEKEAVDAVLAEFFEQQDDGWHQHRADHEISLCDRNRDNGKKGGRPRKTENPNVTQKEPRRNPEITQTEPRNNPDVTQDEPKPKAPITHYPIPITHSPGVNLIAATSPDQNPTPSASPPSARKKPFDAAETALQAACRATWKAYGQAYFDRYGTEPVSNAMVRSQVKQFVQRVGMDESPHVAAFFVGHPDAFYAKKGHAIGSALADAEKLRTEWATQRTITGTQAMQAERTASNLANAQSAIAMLHAEGIR